MPYDNNEGPTMGGRTQDYRSAKMKSSPRKKSGSSEQSYNSYNNAKGTTGLQGLKPVSTYGKGSGAYEGKDTFHGMSKGGNTAKKAQSMYGTPPSGGIMAKGSTPGYKKGWNI